VRRSASSIFVVTVVLVQGLSLCACRAEQILNYLVSHAHAGDSAAAPDEASAACPGERATFQQFCPHGQAKQTSASPWPDNGVALTLADPALWVRQCDFGPPHRADSLADVSVVAGRSLPLLI
jgi:hypothetical protein